MSKYRCFMDFEYTTTGDKSFDENNDGIEIISIAGVVVDENNNTIDEFNQLVRPIKNVVLHPFCTELTGITQDMIDEASFFSSVADNFMDFIKKYMEDELFIYVWGDFDTQAIDRTFKINRYSGDFEYIRDKIVNIQKRICCTITYKGKVIKSVWNLQNIKKVYNLPVSDHQHNALYDARDLRDVFLAFKNKKPRNAKLIKYFYEKSLADKVLHYFNKTMFFNRVPGELKYGLANLFKNTVHKNIGTEGIKFNKKTMMFENYEYHINNENSQEEIVKLDSEIIRYSKVQMITKVNYTKDIIDGYEVEKPVFSLYFTTISNKLGYDYEINTVHHIPMNPRNIVHVGIFFRATKRYDKLYDVNSLFEDKYNMYNKLNLIEVLQD